MIRPVALLVTGSRTWTDYPAVVGALCLTAYPRGTLLVHGDAKGADRFAARWWQERGDVAVAVPYFGHLGRRGGPCRNVVLADLMESLVRNGEYLVRVEAFDMGTVGTGQMCALAASRGFEVRRHKP